MEGGSAHTCVADKPRKPKFQAKRPRALLLWISSKHRHLHAWPAKRRCRSPFDFTCRDWIGHLLCPLHSILPGLPMIGVHGSATRSPYAAGLVRIDRSPCTQCCGNVVWPWLSSFESPAHPVKSLNLNLSGPRGALHSESRLRLGLACPFTHSLSDAGGPAVPSHQYFLLPRRATARFGFDFCKSC